MEYITLVSQVQEMDASIIVLQISILLSLQVTGILGTMEEYKYDTMIPSVRNISSSCPIAIIHILHMVGMTYNQTLGLYDETWLLYIMIIHMSRLILRYILDDYGLILQIHIVHMHPLQMTSDNGKILCIIEGHYLLLIVIMAFLCSLASIQIEAVWEIGQ